MFQLSDNAVAVLEKRYLIKNKDGKVIETPEQMFQRVARSIAGAEIHDSSEVWEERFFKIMSNLEFLPNSPTLINAGRELGQLSACFVLPLEDSMDSIFTTLRDAVLIQKSGGGTGFSFSSLRPKGGLVKSTQKCAGGPVAFMRVFDGAMSVITQGGARRGANMGILRVDHPDIIDFIYCKSVEGDLVNFNISIGITDEFMAAVKHNTTYDLINPVNGMITSTQSARSIFEMIVEAAWTNGEPGLIFLDEINRYNAVHHLGEITACNPCGEQPLLPYESCNLGSLNLGRFVKGSEIDWNRLKYVTQTAVRFLDNVIDMNKYPTSQIETRTKSTRKIGLGIMGFADLLIKMDIKYDTQEAVSTATQVWKFIHDEARLASIDLAEIRGVFPAFRGSTWYHAGTRARNAALTTIAPTGTLSIIGNCSSGIEPYFSKSTKKKILNTILEEEIEYAKEDCFITAHNIEPEWHVKIQAAFQRYSDSAVSKTINFPNLATKADVYNAYMLAHRLKCKGITIYRDNSRSEQVLNAVEKCPDCGADIINEGGCQTCGAKCGWSACRIS